MPAFVNVMRLEEKYSSLSEKKSRILLYMLKDFAQVRMSYLYANYKLSTSITVERGVSKHAIAFICHPARVAQFLMQSAQS